MARMQSNTPTTKVMGASLGGALSVLLIYLVSDVFGLVDDVPETVQVAVTTLITFTLGYFTPPSERDSVVPS